MAVSQYYEEIYVPELLDGVEAIRDWLSTPSETTFASLKDIAGHIDHIGTYEQALYALVWSAASSRLDEAAAFIARDLVFAYQMPVRAGNVLTALLKQWHLDTAWNILRGKSAPAIPNLEDETLYALSLDIQRAYNDQNLEALVFQMSEEQQGQLRQILIERSIAFAEPHLTSHPQFRLVQPYFHTIVGWQSSNAILDYETVSKVSHSISQSHRPPLSRIVQDLCVMFYGATRDLEYSIYRIAENGQNLARDIAALQHHIAEDAERYANPILRAAVARMRHWQIEAAWAILHDREVPPLD